MKDVTIALVQQASLVGAKAANLARTEFWVRRAVRAGARLVCFPELNLTGHAGHPAMIDEAEPVPGGPSVERLIALARQAGIFICAGIAEEERGIHYNTQFLVGPEGYIGKQRKVHLSRDEYFFFRGGLELAVFELSWVRVGIVICFDNLFPETARCMAVRGAELLLCPHAARFGRWPRDASGRRGAVARLKEEWRLVHRCRAYDNGCYVALCNAVGRSAPPLRGVLASHAGGCMVIGPAGDVLAESRSRDIREEMLVAHLRGRLVSARRRQVCFNLRVRRPEVFAALAQIMS